MNRLPPENVIVEIAPLLQQAIVGYRFHPTDEELINYLKSKVTGCREIFCIIPTLENIYEINPWDLPAAFNEKSVIRSQDLEWWFICPRTQNQRISRKTPCGSSWKITGIPIDIKAKNDDRKIGSKQALVFMDGWKSKGTGPNWVVHEFHPHPDDTGFVLCHLKMKQGEKADNQEPYIQAAEFKGKESTMIQPQKKKADGKIESDNISHWKTWNDSLLPTRLTASASCHGPKKSTIDPRVLIAMSFALVLLAYVIVHGICRMSDGVNETLQFCVFFRRF